MSRKLVLCPSIMNLPVTSLSEEIYKINESDIDILHLDLMDGRFVNNFGMSFREIEAVRALTDKQIDCHMMVMEPRRYIKNLVSLGVNIVYIHPEAELIPSATLDEIKNQGLLAGIVINPCTSFSQVKDLLALSDFVLLMGVNPGFAGRSFMPYLRNKFWEFSSYRKSNDMNFHLILDGGATMEVISDLYLNLDIEGFVLGKQEYFFQQRSYQESVDLIRTLENKGELFYEQKMSCRVSGKC